MSDISHLYQELIIDLDDLEFREYTNGYDLFQNSLPRIRKPEKNKYIGVNILVSDMYCYNLECKAKKKWYDLKIVDHIPF